MLFMASWVALLYVLDQVSKWAIVLNYKEPLRNYVMESTPLIQGSDFMNLNIIRRHNSGVAFGLGLGTAWAPVVFLGVQLIALVGLTVLLRRGFFSTRLLRVAWVFIMTGVLGNMTDRLLQGFWLDGADKLGFWENLSRGYVVDFIDCHFPSIVTENFPMGYHWPAFNVADSCICIAAALFFLSSFLTKDKETSQPTKP